MFRVTRYPMIYKTESGRVGYRKKYRVAGRVRVPAGHCTGCLKKNFLLWKLGVANITADNEKSTIIFFWQMQVIHFVIHISIIWLGYISENGKVITIQHQAWIEKQQDNMGQIHHMYPYIYLTPENGLEFYLCLQKFNMDFSLSAVIFATANFH